MTYIGSVARFNSDPMMYAISANNCETKVLNDEYYAGKSGGCGFCWEQAVMSALGEGVERYCSTFYDKKGLILGSYNELLNKGSKAIRPGDFSLFHTEQYNDKQFPFIPFTDDTKVYWEQVTDMFTHEKVYCPATFVYMPFSIDNVNISEQISTGFAAHTDFYRAFLNGLYEVIERDAFMITWMNKLNVPKIAITGKLTDFVNAVVPKHMSIHLFDMTTDIKVPSIMGMLTGKHEFGDFVAFSAATRMTYTEAIQKTTLELCQSVPYYRYLLYKNKKEMKDFRELISFEDHSIFYTRRPEYNHVFADWRDKTPEKTVPFGEEKVHEPISIMKDVLHMFQEKKINIYCKDITTVDVSEENFKVLRVICPTLIPLNGTYGRYYLGGNRLYEAPEKMGFNRTTYETLTQMPHPFP
jgi:ribosomal protein S12 methylthiotransferase accessory factor